MKLYMVRHGQSTANLAHGLAGWSQVPLTEKGFDDARETGRLLKGMTFDRIYSSDLLRARETAQTAIPGCVPIEDPLLREINVGSLAGKSPEECNTLFGPVYRDYRKERNFTRYGGENKQQLLLRIASFVDKLAEEASSLSNVIIFGHEGSCKAMLAHVVGDDKNTACDNGSLSCFCYERGCWKLEFWNLTTAKLPAFSKLPE